MNRPTLQQAIAVTQNAPDLIVERFHGIFLPSTDDGDDAKLLEAFREKYRVIGYWLSYFLLHQNHLKFELLNTRKQLCKPFAEILMNYFNLAKHLSTHPKSYAVLANSPEYLLLTIGLQHCSEDLSNSGYLNTPQPEGKEKTYALAREYYDSLINKSKSIFVRSEDKGVALPAKEFLERLGAWVAKYDINFRNGYFTEYVRSQKRCYRQIKCNPQLKAAYLDGFHLKSVNRGGKYPSS